MLFISLSGFNINHHTQLRIRTGICNTEFFYKTHACRFPFSVFPITEGSMVSRCAGEMGISSSMVEYTGQFIPGSIIRSGQILRGKFMCPYDSMICQRPLGRFPIINCCATYLIGGWILNCLQKLEKVHTTVYTKCDVDTTYVNSMCFHDGFWGNGMSRLISSRALR